MVGIAYLVVQILSRHASVSFCLIVNESQAELDCQYEFPMISSLKTLIELEQWKKSLSRKTTCHWDKTA